MYCRLYTPFWLQGDNRTPDIPFKLNKQPHWKLHLLLIVLGTLSPCSEQLISGICRPLKQTGAETFNQNLRPLNACGFETNSRACVLVCFSNGWKIRLLKKHSSAVWNCQQQINEFVHPVCGVIFNRSALLHSLLALARIVALIYIHCKVEFLSQCAFTNTVQTISKFVFADHISIYSAPIEDPQMCMRILVQPDSASSCRRRRRRATKCLTA